MTYLRLPMAKRKVFIRSPEFLPEVAQITGTSLIFLEYEFEKSQILGQDVCVVEIELTKKQADEIDRAAQRRSRTIIREAGNGGT